MFGGLRVHVTWWVIELFQVCTALLLALLARMGVGGCVHVRELGVRRDIAPS